MIEERTEDQIGKVLVKKKYVYNEAGQLAQVIGYPQNKESILMSSMNMMVSDASLKLPMLQGMTSTIIYDDAYINEWGQKTRKRTLD